MKKIFNSRFFSIVILLLVVSAVFTACTGGAQQTTVTKEVKNYNGQFNKLSEEQLDSIATTLYNNVEARDAFLAAYRGYDVIDGQDTDFSENKGVNYDYVKKVITKYTGIVFKAPEEVVPTPDETTPDETTPDAENPDATTPDAENPDATTPTETPENDLPEFVKEDADLILAAMQDTVSIQENRDLLGNIRYYIGMALNWITNTIGFGSYLIGICIFAIVIEIVMIPFAIKQQKNSIKQAKLRPKEMAIRNRYKGRNDQATQQKVTQEIQELYQRENFNPMSGCLPMLLQLPIVMILYNIVVDPIQNVLGKSTAFANALKTFFTASPAAGGIGGTIGSSSGTIELLSQLNDPGFAKIGDFALFSNGSEVASELAGITNNLPSFNIGDLNFGYTPSFNDHYYLLIVPVLTFLVYFYSMKISKKFTYQATQNEQAPGAGCSTKMMEFSMPAMSTFFCFMVPGAVGIYWVFRSILTTFKQFIMSKVMPLPKFTEEDYKDAEREFNSKKPQRKRKNNADLDPDRERPRSLHHIDDDDEEYITFVK